MTDFEGSEGLRTASEQEIKIIIGDIAKQAIEENGGYFYINQVRDRFENLGISPGSQNFSTLLRNYYHTDPFGPRQNPEGRGTGPQPYNANDPVMNIEENPLKGMPDLRGRSKSIVQGRYRSGGQKSGGISPQAPKDID